MIDTLLHEMDQLTPPECFDQLKLQPKEYLVLTLHRPAKVDAESKLGDTLKAIMESCGGLPVLFPVHPRTAKQLEKG